jgi:hypothetical protein
VDGLPHDIDERLWIDRGCAGYDFLVGNCHTFPGGMAAYCPHGDGGRDVCVSLGEIREMSDESALWTAGFLAGNEPSGEAMFGDAWADVGRRDYREAEWQRAALEFRRTGEWPRTDT